MPPYIAKPTVGSAVRTGHPLAQGLIDCWLFNEGAGRIAMGAQRNLAFNGNAGWAGGAVSLPGAATDYLSITAPPDAPYLGAITLLWRGVVNTGSAFRHFAGKHAGNGGTDCPFDFRTDNQAIPVIQVVRAKALSTSVQHNGPAIVLGALKTYAVTFADGDIGTLANFYVDGVLTGDTKVGAGTGNVTGTTADLRIGVRADGVVIMDGRCEFFAAWSRALSQSEIRALSVDPYAMFTRRRASVAILAQPLLFIPWIQDDAA